MKMTIKLTIAALIASLLLTGCGSPRTSLGEIYEDTPYGKRIDGLKAEYDKVMKESQGFQMMRSLEKGIERAHMKMIDAI